MEYLGSIILGYQDIGTPLNNRAKQASHWKGKHLEKRILVIILSREATHWAETAIRG